MKASRLPFRHIREKDPFFVFDLKGFKLRSAGFEPTLFESVARHFIQLSYERLKRFFEKRLRAESNRQQHGFANRWPTLGT